MTLFDTHFVRVTVAYFLSVGFIFFGALVKRVVLQIHL